MQCLDVNQALAVLLEAVRLREVQHVAGLVEDPLVAVRKQQEVLAGPAVVRIAVHIVIDWA